MQMCETVEVESLGCLDARIMRCLLRKAVSHEGRQLRERAHLLKAEDWRGSRMSQALWSPDDATVSEPWMLDMSVCGLVFFPPYRFWLCFYLIFSSCIIIPYIRSGGTQCVTECVLLYTG